MVTSRIQIDEGSTTNTATNTISEDAVTKHIPRTVLNTSAGVEVAPLTDTQLRATAAPVSGTVAVTNAGITSIDGKITACNTGAVTVSSSALPTGASTSAKQDTGNTSLSSIDGKVPALGQALAAASVPVILPSATITTLTPPAAITNFVNETGGNLAAIKAKTDNIPAQGQALAAASIPVVLTAAQITTLTPVSAVTATLAAETTKVIGTVNDKVADGDLITLGAKADAKSTATDTTAITAMQVLKQISYSSQNPPSSAVTNAGTFAVQSTDSVNSQTIKSIKAAYTASQTASTVLTPTSGKKFVVTDIIISASAAGTIYLFDHTDGATACLTPTLALAANGGMCNAFKGLYQATAANNLIKYTSGSGAAGSILVYYYEV